MKGNNKYLFAWYGLLVIISLFFVAVLTIPSQAMVSINNIQYREQYDGQVLPVSDIRAEIIWNASVNAWDIWSIAGLYRVLPTQTFDYIIDPVTMQPLSMYAEWKGEYYKTTGQGSWVQHGIITKTVTKVNDYTLVRSLKTTEGSYINVSYILRDKELKMLIFIEGSGRQERLTYSIDFNNGRQTSLDMNSKRFNLNLSDYATKTILDISDIQGETVTNIITQGNRLNIMTTVNASQIISLGSNFTIDPSWTVNNATTTGWSSSNVTRSSVRINSDYKLGLSYNSTLYNGLVGCWDMDVTTGTIMKNCNNNNGSLNNTNTGTLYGETSFAANTTSGVIGNAFKFDGSNDYILSNDVIRNFDTISLSTWVWYNSAQPNSSIGGLFCDINGQQNSRLYITSGTNKVSSGVYIAGSSTTRTTTNEMNNGSWNFVVYTYNSTHESIFLNGITTSFAKTGILNNGTDKIRLGVGVHALNNYWLKGIMDESKLWNRALSASEIAEEYNRSMVTSGNITIQNQQASVGNVISTVNMTSSGGDANHNISIYGNKSGVPGWVLIQANAVSGMNYTIPAGIQNRTMDFQIVEQGNGSNTVFLESMILYDTLDTTYTLFGYTMDGTNSIPGVNVSTTNYTGSFISTLSNATGYYELPGLKGDYTITANLTGYLQNVSIISVNGDTTYNISLTPGQYNLNGYTKNRLNNIVPYTYVYFNGSLNISDANGYYYFNSIYAGNHTLETDQVGYWNNTSQYLFNQNTSHNITLDERIIAKRLSGFQGNIFTLSILSIIILFKFKRNT